MQFQSLLALAASVSAAQAKETIAVWVGMSSDGTAGFVFSPERVTAPVGSVVQFQFMSGNHTVTQSSFDDPCLPLNNANGAGFFSGFVPAAASKKNSEVAVFNVSIQDAKPIWVYCSQGKHCQNGMSMVINENTKANKTRSLENYRALAASVPKAGYPGDGTSDADSGSSPGSGNDTTVHTSMEDATTAPTSDSSSGSGSNDVPSTLATATASSTANGDSSAATSGSGVETTSPTNSTLAAAPGQHIPVGVAGLIVLVALLM